MIVLLMGVSGSGKTTIGTNLAVAMGAGFTDADSLHSDASRAKMAAGIALTDEDRAPWLSAISAAIRDARQQGGDHVFACSALKRDYRLRLDPDHVVYLKGDAALLSERLASRQGHFFNPALLQSQLDTLEEPKDAITLDIRQPPTNIVRSILHSLSRDRPRGQDDS